MRRIRFGIFGTGAIAQRFAASLAYAPECTLQAVASRTEERARAFADALGVARSGTSYEELAEAADIDIIYIATPNMLHAEHMLLCLERGKPVLCEKPFTLSADEARMVVAKARETRTFCMEAMWIRFLPATRKAMSLLQAGAIGEVRTLEAGLCFANVEDPLDRRYNVAYGGGALLDLGVYPVSLAHHVLGAPIHVAASATYAATGVETQAGLVLSYEGALATLSCGFTSTGPNRALITGTHGAICLREPLLGSSLVELQRWAPPQAASSAPPIAKTARRRPWPMSHHRSLRDLARKFSPHKSKRFIRVFPGTGLHFQAQEAARCLLAGEVESPIMPLDESLAVMETIDRARAQMNSGPVPDRICPGTPREMKR